MKQEIAWDFIRIVTLVMVVGVLNLCIGIWVIPQPFLQIGFTILVGVPLGFPIIKFLHPNSSWREFIYRDTSNGSNTRLDKEVKK